MFREEFEKLYPSGWQTLSNVSVIQIALLFGEQFLCFPCAIVLLFGKSGYMRSDSYSNYNSKPNVVIYNARPVAFSL